MAAGHRHWQQNTVRRADHPSAATPTVPSDTHRPQRHPSSPATSPVPSDITSPERHLQSAAASPVRSVFRLAPSAIPGGESLLAMKHRPRTHIPIQPSYHLLRLYHADISYYITPTDPNLHQLLTFHPLHRLPCPVAPEGPSLPSKRVFNITDRDNSTDPSLRPDPINRFDSTHRPHPATTPPSTPTMPRGPAVSPPMASSIKKAQAASQTRTFRGERTLSLVVRLSFALSRVVTIA